MSKDTNIVHVIRNGHDTCCGLSIDTADVTREKALWLQNNPVSAGERRVCGNCARTAYFKYQGQQ